MGTLGDRFVPSDHPELICEVTWNGRMSLQPHDAPTYGRSSLFGDISQQPAKGSRAYRTPAGIVAMSQRTVFP